VVAGGVVGGVVAGAAALVSIGAAPRAGVGAGDDVTWVLRAGDGSRRKDSQAPIAPTAAATIITVIKREVKRGSRFRRP
jgi:hypothetical protein